MILFTALCSEKKWEMKIQIISPYHPIYLFQNFYKADRRLPERLGLPVRAGGRSTPDALASVPEFFFVALEKCACLPKQVVRLNGQFSFFVPPVVPRKILRTENYRLRSCDDSPLYSLLLYKAIQ